MSGPDKVVLADVLRLLDLETIEKDIFRGHPKASVNKPLIILGDIEARGLQ